jgi:hypothetical protein
MSEGRDRLYKYISAVLYANDVTSEVDKGSLTEEILDAITQDEFYIDSEGIHEIIESESNADDDGYIGRQIYYKSEENYVW